MFLGMDVLVLSPKLLLEARCRREHLKKLNKEAQGIHYCMPCIFCMVGNIKQYLKSVGITQKEFADKIGLSRPTLDSYIYLYENDEIIPKERYEIIFKKLFGDGEVSSDEFNERFKWAQSLLSRDYNYGINNLDTLAADYVSLILKNMKRDLMETNWNKDIYTFINCLISNYRNENFYVRLVEYFIYLNDIRGIDEIQEEQKPYFANIYRAFRSLKDNPIKYDQKDYKAFIDRCNENHDKKVNAEKDQRENIKKRIKSMMNEFKNMGIELDDAELLEELRKQIIQEKISIDGSDK